ncbi:MAG TPA: ABC transporter substrate-binding protein [Stellaceae bacterium]|nr:ABC transporter substrate-binding protein [Stellaceae bacterium]
MSRTRKFALAILAFLAAAPAARALDKVNVGTAVWPIWAFLPLQVGVDEGIWPKYNIEPTIVNSGSGAKLFQALASGSVDLGLSSGVEMAFSAKGAPVKAVAAFAGEPRTVTIIVPAGSPVKAPPDLKGKIVAMPGVGSVSEWLLWQMEKAQGWSKADVKANSAGSLGGAIALIESRQADAAIGPPELGYMLEAQGKGHVAFSLAPFAPHFHAHVVYARDELIDKNPDLVARFLKGFFAAIDYMKTHKQETTAIAVRELHSTPEIMGRIWDELAPWLDDKGTFDPQALAVLKQSYVDLQILDRKPKDDEILTTRFVPVKP